MNGLNVIAADPTEAYVIEMTSDEIYVEKDEGRGVLFRTNHVVSDQLSHFNPPEENYPSTHKRYDRIAQMVEERYGSRISTALCQTTPTSRTVSAVIPTRASPPPPFPPPSAW